MGEVGEPDQGTYDGALYVGIGAVLSCGRRWALQGEGVIYGKEPGRVPGCVFEDGRCGRGLLKRVSPGPVWSVGGIRGVSDDLGAVLYAA